MDTVQLTLLAKTCASADTEGHSYTQKATSPTWVPHRWVVEAMGLAYHQGVVDQRKREAAATAPLVERDPAVLDRMREAIRETTVQLRPGAFTPAITPATAALLTAHLEALLAAERTALCTTGASGEDLNPRLGGGTA